MLTRSLATVGMGIRVNALCPEYVNTPLLSDFPSSLTDFLRDRVGFVELEKVIAGKHPHFQSPLPVNVIASEV